MLGFASFARKKRYFKKRGCEREEERRASGESLPRFRPSRGSPREKGMVGAERSSLPSGSSVCGPWRLKCRVLELEGLRAESSPGHFTFCEGKRVVSTWPVCLVEENI